MDLKEQLFKELAKKGYSKRKTGEKVWDVANRSLLYATPELADSFLKFRNHERYKKIVVDREISLLKDVFKEVGNELMSEPINLIDMGCGDGLKAKEFLKLFRGGKIRYCPVSVSDNLIELAEANVRSGKFAHVVEYHSKNACLESLGEVASELRNGEFKRNIILLLGSILSSFEIHEYLFNLTQGMLSGDLLIVGNGVRKGERFMNIETYKHPYFEEWLFLLIKELGFSKNEVEYGARFENGRAEGFYTLKVNKIVERAGEKIKFSKGDEIVVAYLYKYFEKELKKYFGMYFREIEMFKDDEGEIAVGICRK